MTREWVKTRELSPPLNKPVLVVGAGGELFIARLEEWRGRPLWQIQDFIGDFTNGNPVFMPTTNHFKYWSDLPARPSNIYWKDSQD